MANKQHAVLNSTWSLNIKDLVRLGYLDGKEKKGTIKLKMETILGKEITASFDLQVLPAKEGFPSVLISYFANNFLYRYILNFTRIPANLPVAGYVHYFNFKSEGIRTSTIFLCPKSMRFTFMEDIHRGIHPIETPLKNKGSVRVVYYHISGQTIKKTAKIVEDKKVGRKRKPKGIGASRLPSLSPNLIIDHEI